MPTPPLTDVEVRILGALVEKQVTTPDSYPLSLGALTAACNQSSNREPVMRLDEGAVSEALTPIRRRGLLRAIQPSGSRVMKYQHLLDTAWNLDARELAVLTVLMLRGPQTPGELHARTARLAEFADIAALESTLDALIARDAEPLVTRLPRRPGQKEMRYAHLLAGEPSVAESADALVPAAARASDDADRIATLERTVDVLRDEIAAVRAELAEFRAQFG